ncbi:uncharacterized serine/threonine-protein kinase SBK3 [Tachyglossus aculeatus]|uniref:uncharacterized serine/threonine-protein kinase SBK3 n=1 Tax=Tachyglossus aculeatus TaxID=9261 RepID=UPI0018F69036|nr:uncharacterized serine/threonine-protein kinase SBK3 [Tachyglossus aculeatus]
MECGDAETPDRGGLEPEEDNAVILERLMEQTARELTTVRLRSAYRLLRDLGSGSYGRVLLVRPRAQSSAGRPLPAAVALKLLPKASTPFASFLREFTVGRCVSSHPGLLRTLPPPLETPKLYGFMQELAPRGDLSSLLEDGKGLPERRLKRVAGQLAGALDFLHGHGLVHGDVKPDNVLLFDASCRRVKLGDFGLSRPEGAPVGAPAGPLPSAPPELCLVHPPDTLALDPSLDAWGLGVLLFTAATSQFPWEVALAPDPAFEAFAAWLNAWPPQEPPLPWSGFSSEALTLFRGLLALDPERRRPPLTVLEVLEADWGVGRGGESGGEEEEEKRKEEEEDLGDGESSLEEWTDEEGTGEGDTTTVPPLR